MGTLKPQSNGPLYSSTVIGTLAVNADPALYDVFWLDRWRHRASLQLCISGLPDNTGSLAKFELSEQSNS